MHGQLWFDDGPFLESIHVRTPSLALKIHSLLRLFKQLSQKSLGAKSLRSRRQVCHSWSVPGDS